MSKVDEALKTWAEHWVAQGVPALEAEAIAVGALTRGIVYARLTRLESVAAAARAVVETMIRWGMQHGMAREDCYLGDTGEALRKALRGLDKEVSDVDSR